MRPSPIVALDDHRFREKRILVFMKRDDLLGGPAQGNKWRKLRYWMQLAHQRKYKSLVTFGGAFSNHLHATAWAAAQHGLHATGYVRGEYDPRNPTLKACKNWGMEFVFLPRSEYRHLKGQDQIQSHTNALIIPEGGAGEPGIRGIRELGLEIQGQDSSFTHWICAAGTGATVMGLRASLPTDSGTEVIACDVLKRRPPQVWIDCGITVRDSSFGGFAKHTTELLDLMRSFHASTQIFLDPIYTAKMMATVYQMIKEDDFAPASKILVIHTGGYQGILGFNYRFDENLPLPNIGEPDPP